MSNDLVSIVMPTYNRAHLIGDTIRSIMAQTHQHWELIVVDDGSTDNTEAIVNDFRSDKIQYHQFTHGNGMIDRLRNFGMREAKGRYVALADSDDIWLPHRLSTQISLLQKYPSARFSICHGYEFTKEKIWSVDSVFLNRNQDNDNIFVGNLLLPMLRGEYISYLTLVFEKEILDTVGYMDETLKYCHGHDFLLRVLANCEGIAVNEKLIKIRKHDQSTSLNRATASMVGTFEIFKRLYNNGFIPEDLYEKLVSDLHYQLGKVYLEKHEVQQARRNFLSYIKLRPLRLNGWMRLGQSIVKK